MAVEVVRVIDAPATRVWDLLVTVSHWPRWGPSVTAVTCDGERIQLGTVGTVRTVAGIRLPFRVTEFVPGRHWRWRVCGVTATGHRLEPLGPDRSRLIFEIPRWAIAYAPVCRLAGSRIARICAEEPRNGAE